MKKIVRKLRVRPADSEIENSMFENLETINKYNNRIDEINESKNKVVAKSIRFRNHELSYLKPFLKDNNLSVGALVKFLFYQAGVWDDLAVYVMGKKGMDTSFTTLDPRKWIRTKVDRDILTEEEHKELYQADNKGEAPSLNMHRFQAEIADQWLGANATHFNKFIKLELFEFNIFPANLKEAITDTMKSKTTKKSKNERDKKKNINYRPLTLTSSTFERGFINNFIFFVGTTPEPNSLSIAKVIKIMLYEQGYIGGMERFNTDELRETLNELREKFDGTYNYLERKKYKKLTRDAYIKEYKAGKTGSSENLSISFSNQDADKLVEAYTAEGFESITPFVRKHVYEELGIYPFPEVLELIEDPKDTYKKRGRKKA